MEDSKNKLLYLCLRSSQASPEAGFVSKFVFRRFGPFFCHSKMPAPGMPQLQVIKEYLENLPWSDSELKEQEKQKCLLQFYLLSLAESKLSIRKSRLSCSEFQETMLSFVQDFHIAENCRLLPGEENGNPVLQEVQRRDVAILKQVEHLFLELKACFAPLGKTGGEEFALSDFVRIFLRLMNKS